MDRCIHELPAEQCDSCSPAAALTTEGVCRWCNRPLRDPLSVELGVGPLCFQREEDPARRLPWLAQMHPWPDYTHVGPLPESTAKLWTNALGRLDGIETHYRTRDDGLHMFIRRQGPGEV